MFGSCRLNADPGSRCIESPAFAITLIALAAASLISCAPDKASAKQNPLTVNTPEVGVVKAFRKTLARHLTVSSELVPFYQIDVYAKESGFVKELNVDFGSHVKKGDVMAVLEIPELRLQLDEDQAGIKDATGQVERAKNELGRVEAQQKVAHLEYTRLASVAKTKKGLVAQQEVDDREGADLALQAQVDASKSNLESAQDELTDSEAKLRHDQAIYDYSRITAPFTGIVTQLDANLGTLMQSGVNSSTQAMPLVQLSEDDKFRLVIPVSESWVRYIRIGDPVEVRVPSMDRTFPGKVARFSVEVKYDTRTMHTEVDVYNPQRILVPGLYAEATLTLDQQPDVLAVPQEAVNIDGDKRSVWVVDSSHKVEERPVTTGIETPHDVEIISGLKEGEMVAVGNRSALTVGEVVRPKPVQIVQLQDQQDE